MSKIAYRGANDEWKYPALYGGGVGSGGIGGGTDRASTSTSTGIDWENYVDRFDRPQTPESPTTPTVNPLEGYFTQYQNYVTGLQSNTQKAYDQMLKYYQNASATYTPSAWQGKADDAMEQYLNRGPFQYDINADALYQQYKDQYIQQGRMAMMDTMGQAAAMTGGYGNSYAQSVGQQAYNQQLTQLNNVVPELYGMAQDRYDQEGQDILNRYSLYSDREAQEYEKYQQALAQWQSGGQALQDAYAAAQSQYTQATTYKDLSLEESDALEKAFERAESQDDLLDLVDYYESLGYNPATIYALASAKDRKLG